MIGRQNLCPGAKTTLIREPPAWRELLVSGRREVRTMCPDSIDLWVWCPSAITNRCHLGKDLISLRCVSCKIEINKKLAEMSKPFNMFQLSRKRNIPACRPHSLPILPSLPIGRIQPEARAQGNPWMDVGPMGRLPRAWSGTEKERVDLEDNRIPTLQNSFPWQCWSFETQTTLSPPGPDHCI